jgi:hypothetical protein
MFSNMSREQDASVSTNASSSSSTSRIIQRRVHIATLHKTKCCIVYHATGSCTHGASCAFAHGLKELRTQQENLRDGLTSNDAIERWTTTARRGSAVNRQGSQAS